MTIEYILEVLDCIIEHKPDDFGDIDDINRELQKAVRRCRRRILRLRDRAQYEIGEMDKAKVAATSGHMEQFTKAFRRLQNVDLRDCKDLTGIQKFFEEGFRVDDMVARADKIAALGSLGSLAYSPMELGFGILGTYRTVPSISIDNKLFKAKDEAYLKTFHNDLCKFREKVRKNCEWLIEVAQMAREEADLLNDLADYFTDGIDDIQDIIDKSGTDWKVYSESQKMQIGRAVQVAQLITMLFPHLLNEDGQISKDAEKAIEEARKALKFRDA
jgi:hypothetical protein